jgi:hypothetical protein
MNKAPFRLSVASFLPSANQREGPTGEVAGKVTDGLCQKADLAIGGHNLDVDVERDSFARRSAHIAWPPASNCAECDSKRTAPSLTASAGHLCGSVFFVPLVR